MSEPMRVAVVGAGHMGRHHVRIYSQMKDVRLVAVADTNLDRARGMAEPVGALAVTEISPELGPLDAVTIAVPTVHHLTVARPLIERGIAVLIEKPLAPSAAQAEQLAELARRHGTVVQVGHTERFNPVVTAVEQMNIRPKFIETHRISPFTFRSADIGVVFDMMIHDIDIVLHLVRDEVRSVAAVGVNVLGSHEDIANVRVAFRGGAVANLTASRLALKTERRLRVFSEAAYASLDFQKKVGVVVQLQSNIDVIKFAREKKIEDLSQFSAADYSRMVKVEPLVIQDRDALSAEIESFLHCARTKTRPPVSAEDGVAAVRLAETIVSRLREHDWDGAGPDGGGRDRFAVHALGADATT